MAICDSCENNFDNVQQFICIDMGQMENQQMVDTTTAASIDMGQMENQQMVDTMTAANIDLMKEFTRHMTLFAHRL